MPSTLDTFEDFAGALDVTRGSPATKDGVPAPRLSVELGIEGHDPVDAAQPYLGAAADFLQGSPREVTELLLHVLQEPDEVGLG
jgi:hypothetical protein